MTKRQVKTLLSIISFLIAAFGYTFLQSDSEAAPVDTIQTSSTVIVATTTESMPVVSSTVALNATVTHVADGDTITVRIDGEKDDVKIRMLGVNTPESVDPRRPVECFGKEASNFTKTQLQDKRIAFWEDPEADNVDKYGRYLREIVLADGRNFNELLVAEGYAYAYVSFPMMRERKIVYRQLEAEAKAAGRGLWATSTCAGAK